jgi:hypothetical protein
MKIREFESPVNPSSTNRNDDQRIGKRGKKSRATKTVVAEKMDERVSAASWNPRCLLLGS